MTGLGSGLLGIDPGAGAGGGGGGRTGGAGTRGTNGTGGAGSEDRNLFVYGESTDDGGLLATGRRLGVEPHSFLGEISIAAVDDVEVGEEKRH